MKILKLISFLFVFASCDTGENVLPRNEVFVKLYGQQGNQIAVDMEALPNGDIIILGKIDRPISPSFFVIKVDSLGNEIWKNEIADDNPLSAEEPVALAIDNEQSIVAIGNYSDDDENDILIYKISPATGALTQSLRYDVDEFGDCTNRAGNRLDFVGDIAIDENNRYLISGYTQNEENGVEELFVARLTPNLEDDPSWLRTLHPFVTGSECDDFTEEDIFSRLNNEIEITDNGDLLVLTTSNKTDFNAPAGTNIEILYINAQGVIDFSNRRTEFPGTSFNDEINSLTRTNSGFAYIGTVNKGTTTSILVGELNQLGNKISEFELSNRNLRGIDIGKNNRNRLVVLAEEVLSDDDKNFYLSEWSLDGSTQYWEYAYGGNDIDEAAAIHVTENSVFILGTLNLNNQEKILLMRTEANGTL